MTNSEGTANNEQDIGIENTNPTWALGLVAFSVVSFICGLFILPQKVEMVRFVEFPGNQTEVFKHIDQLEDWDAWDAWGHKHQKKGTELHRPFAIGEYEGTLSLTQVDDTEFRVYYELDRNNGAGDLFVERTPDGVRVFWHHSYTCGFGPFSRMMHWLGRGKLALDLDKGLVKLQEMSTVEK